MPLLPTSFRVQPLNFNVWKIDLIQSSSGTISHFVAYLDPSLYSLFHFMYEHARAGLSFKVSLRICIPSIHLSPFIWRLSRFVAYLYFIIHSIHLYPSFSWELPVISLHICISSISIHSSPSFLHLEIVYYSIASLYVIIHPYPSFSWILSISSLHLFISLGCWLILLLCLHLIRHITS